MKSMVQSFGDVISRREAFNGLVTTDDRIRLYNSYVDLARSQQHLNDFENVKENAENCVVQYKSWVEGHELPQEYPKYLDRICTACIQRYNNVASIFQDWDINHHIGARDSTTTSQSRSSLEWSRSSTA